MTKNNEKYKVLLVEDEPNIARLFTYNFKKAGFNYELAENGKEGIEKVKTFMPDIIISDIMMPVMDGYEFRRNLLLDEQLKNIPFIFLTAKGKEDDILYGYDLDIQDYIIKTAGTKVIIAKILSMLKNKQVEREKAVQEVHKAADKMGAKVVPDDFPKFDGFEIKHWHSPYKNIPGGDFIDYVKLNDNNLIVILGDVMGKKWDAWYFAVAYAGYVRSAVRFILQSKNTDSPAQIMQKVNESIYNDERLSEVFITLSVISIDNKTMMLKYSGAGDLPIIYKSGSVKTIQSDGVLLGINENSNYSDEEILLKTNDQIFLTTDGIPDSRNISGKAFGSERLIQIIKNLKPEDDSLKIIQQKFNEFTHNNADDDISLICIKVL